MPSPNLLNLLLSNGQAQPQNQPIDQARFQQMLPRISENDLKQLVIQARQQGISDEQIEQGLDFILKMR